MLIPKGLPPSKLITLIAVIIITFSVSGYLIYTNFIADDQGDATKTNGNRAGQEELFSAPLVLPDTSEFDPNFFNDPALRILKNYGPLPLENGTTFRANPFAPIETSGGVRFPR
ncbi:MAG: hypothetical protein ABIJ81_01095 [Patescibacteria group bacterium]